MKNKKLIINLCLLAVFLLLPLSSNAQEPSAPPKSERKPISIVATATVNIYETKIVSQDKNNITVSFDIYNRKNSQAGVKYAINLVKKESEFNQISVDTKIYDEVLSLSEDTTIKKTIAYQAPEHLSGTYELWVISQNEKGFPFGQSRAGEVTLSGTNEFIGLSNCHLTIQGEAGNRRYTLNEGVAVKPEETLLANCTAKNNFSTEQTVTPIFITFYRNVFGEKMNEAKQESFTIKPNETKEISFILPKAEKPQAYDAVLTLNNSQNKVLSEKIAFHYVLGGTSATIQNLRLDKDYYSKDDTAKMSFFFSLSASNFPGSRLAPVTDEKVNLELSIISNGQACSETVKKEFTKDGQVDLETSITKDCPNPEAKVILKDKDGNILDQSDLKITSQDITAKKTSEIPTEKSKLSTIILLLVVLSSLIIIIAIAFKNKKSKSFKSFLFFFIAGTVILFGTGEVARGDTFYAEYSDGSSNLAVQFIAQTNKGEYKVGEDVLASLSYNSNIGITGPGYSHYACGCYIPIGAGLGYVSLSVRDLEKFYWHNAYYTQYNYPPPIYNRNIGTSYIPGDKDVEFSGAYSINYYSYYQPSTYEVPIYDSTTTYDYSSDIYEYPIKFISDQDYHCTAGDSTANASLCSQDNISLSEDTKIELKESCSKPEGSNPKCEFVCNPGYIVGNNYGQGKICQLNPSGDMFIYADADSCVETNSQVRFYYYFSPSFYSCFLNGWKLNEYYISGYSGEYFKLLSSNTTEYLKCYRTLSDETFDRTYNPTTWYKSNTGKGVLASATVEICPQVFECIGGGFPNSELCDDDDIDLTGNENSILVPFCTASKKCEFKCKNSYTYNSSNGTCARTEIPGEPKTGLTFCQIPSDRSQLCEDGQAVNVRMEQVNGVPMWKWTCQGINGGISKDGSAVRDCSWTEVN